MVDSRARHLAGQQTSGGGAVQTKAQAKAPGSEGGARAHRQSILVLYLGNSSLDSAVVGWSFYRGSPQTHAFDDALKAPFHTGVEALREGWRLISYPQMPPPRLGQEYDTGYLRFEFVFEKWEECDVA